MRALYLDTSAAAKLFQQEAESDALRAWLDAQDDAVVLTCDLTRTELRRALQTADGTSDVAQECASWLADCAQIRLTPELCDAAGRLPSSSRLRSLDAIHLSAAMALGAALTDFVAYDVRLTEAARAAGLPVVSPTGSDPAATGQGDEPPDEPDAEGEGSPGGAARHGES